MTVVTTANLVGITGLARRLVQDGALDEVAARDAMAKATAARQPLPTWFAQNKVVGCPARGRQRGRVRHHRCSTCPRSTAARTR